MRRLDKQINDDKIINEILSKSNICRIALHDDVYPYVVPLNYGYHKNSLYFHCALTGKKIDLIKKNNKVSFVIEQGHKVIKSDISCNWTTKYRSIFGQGMIDIITDHQKKKEGLDIIMQHHGKNDNFYNKSIVDKILILKLSIKSMTAKQSGEWI